MELKCIKGLGQKRIETLQEKGIMSVEDLTLYFPKTYYNLNSQDTFKEDGKYKLLNSTVISDVKVVRIKGNFSYSYCECKDISNQTFKAVWYNQPYIKQAINFGDKLYLYGKNSNTKRNYFVVSNYRNHNKVKEGINFLPIYKTFKNIGQTTLCSIIDSALSLINCESLLPIEIEQNYLNFHYNDAIKLLHNPQTEAYLNQAKERVDIEKILPIIKLNDDLKNKKNIKKTQKYTNFNKIYDNFCTFLPYSLTDEQQNVLADIIADMNKTTPMNRLVQGDVGSGKTIIALMAAALSLESGFSAILIAPTEILASQHYNLAKAYFEKLKHETMLLTSSLSTLEKKSVYNTIQTKPTLIIGTHACLNEQLDISNVGLVVIDEQHRFGVKQRANLVNRNFNLDLLTLSATPIPRSMSIVYYGGMDISTLNKPPKAKQIQTNIIPEQKEDDMWNFIENKIQGESKVYVVCSNIDDNDDDSYLNLSVNSMYKFLCNRFSKDKVLMAHGKLDSELERKTLEKFKNENYKILVSTTIIEVGIDIKEADIIVIVSPEKFGLATMHQLRGRVGRNGQQSYCFCLSRNLNEKSYERIKYFKEHLNGFDIAEFDFTSRGSGNILGTNQHGKIENNFDLFSLSTYNKAQEIFNKLKEQNLDHHLYSKDIEEKYKNIALNWWQF